MFYLRNGLSDRSQNFDQTKIALIKYLTLLFTFFKILILKENKRTSFAFENWAT